MYTCSCIRSEARKEYMSETTTLPPLNSIELNRLYFSNWCMVTESFMTWVFWYLSYIMSSYKHWNVECVGDNHPLIVLNKIGCIFTLVYGYWKFHEMGVLISILHYVLVQTLKCGMCLRQPHLVQSYWVSYSCIEPRRCLRSIQLSSTPYDCTWT
jgi:hypothetical protein